MLTTLSLIFALSTPAQADPCGMVPPAWIPPGDPGITRVGDQITYAFFKDGVQTIAIRPGFTGSVDEFGMLVPFPSPPSMKKMNDATFKHLEAAVDPPIMNIHLYEDIPYPSAAMAPRSAAREMESAAEDDGLRFDEVRVLNQEAVGMYEIAVLEAGSPKALERWMSDHEYKYPDGMDDVVLDYVQSRWVFVAVKAKVGQMPGVTPKPGMRGVDAKLPKGSSFNGHVQGMVFRFAVDEPVVPMRLSTFNGEDARNLVYMLAEEPLKIEQVSTEFVMRQVSGGQLYENVAGLIPYQVHGGKASDIPRANWASIDMQRDPAPYSGVARDQMASDLLAVRTGELVLPFEKEEKELLNLNEAFGMRGPQADQLLEQAVAEIRTDALEGAVRDIAQMTLTVIEGDFPQKVLRNENLTFAEYGMSARRNSADTWTRRPAGPDVWVPMNKGWFR